MTNLSDRTTSKVKTERPVRTGKRYEEWQNLWVGNLERNTEKKICKASLLKCESLQHFFKSPISNVHLLYQLSTKCSDCANFCRSFRSVQHRRTVINQLF